MAAHTFARQAVVLIPAYNEAARIGITISAVRSLAGISQVVVVDDGSTDNTAETAKQAGADKVIVLTRNHGKGGALDAGLAQTPGDVLLLLDADIGETASFAQALLDPVLHNDCDMAVAVFPELCSDLPNTHEPCPSTPKGGGFGMALKLARGGIKMLTGVDLTAPLSGQRALDKRIIESMGGFNKGFGVETALSGWAAAGGWRVREVPLAMSHRRTGKDIAGLMHRARQILHIARALVWLWRNRIRAASAREAAC